MIIYVLIAYYDSSLPSYQENTRESVIVYVGKAQSRLLDIASNWVSGDYSRLALIVQEWDLSGKMITEYSL